VSFASSVALRFVVGPSRLLAAELVAALLLIVVIRRWARHLPYGGTAWYRLVVVSALLMVFEFAIGQVFPQHGSFGIMIGDTMSATVYIALIGLMAVPLMLFWEMFFRGVVYSIVEQARDRPTAVFASALAPLVVALPLLGMNWQVVAPAFILSLALSVSRSMTNSVTPALVTQGIGAVKFAFFSVLVALS
jgi:hypothetical protein